MSKICDFGKAVKKRLVDLDRTQTWLIEQVRSDTGLYFDGGYLYRILSGERRTPAVMESICKILEIPAP